ncbi:MAG: Na+/H+ antiporter NhaC family protein, partial [Lawsonibacter sp.]|nr:Na+/H+ antiporter NhaC family protein [Lawsonibacter sp.]
MESKENKIKSNPTALLPIGVFLVLYLGCGLLFEYGLHIELGFYQTPAIVAFLIALFVACLQNRKLDFNAKLKVMATGVADENILTMCLVFLVAGAFSGAISAAGGAESTVNLFLTFLPIRFAVAGLFLISCFVSLSMGTSVGTISALAPFAVAMSKATGFDVVLCISAVASGAMFGDNLSMISDTTIAAVRTQGCEMKDKFRMNFFIVLPAAVITVLLFLFLTPAGSGALTIGAFDVWKVLPYLVVLVGAVIGINVFLILILGSVLSLIVGVATGAFAWTQVFSVMGNGITAMYDIT